MPTLHLRVLQKVLDETKTKQTNKNQLNKENPTIPEHTVWDY